ncbi:MAG: hypothetical protein GF311_01460 [Candidatus Lokiarchaeota archaeon]|nr:hypothetical protein [Candidatus Lokiarchaeota archaeon]
MAEGVVSGATAASQILIQKLLKSNDDILIPKSVKINGVDNSINFSFCLYKGSYSNEELMEVLVKKFSNCQIELDKSFRIKIKNHLEVDISNDIIEKKKNEKRISFEKILNRNGDYFTVEISGAFKENFNSLMTITPNIEAYYRDEFQETYHIIIYIHHHKYKTRNVSYINIPITNQILPLEFVYDFLLSDIEQKALNYWHKTKGTKKSRVEKSITQKWGFHPDTLSNKLSTILAETESLIRARFNEIFQISINPPGDNLRISGAEIKFGSIQRFPPTILIKPNLLFDYDYGMNTYFSISITINRKKLIQMISKKWRRIKRRAKSQIY